MSLTVRFFVSHFLSFFFSQIITLTPPTLTASQTSSHPLTHRTHTHTLVHPLLHLHIFQTLANTHSYTLKLSKSWISIHTHSLSLISFYSLCFAGRDRISSSTSFSTQISNLCKHPRQDSSGARWATEATSRGQIHRTLLPSLREKAEDL